MPFYIYAWIANIFYGLSTVVAKLISKEQITNPWLLNFSWGLLNIPFFLVFAIPNGVGWPTHWGAIWLVGIFTMLAGTLYILALYRLDVSILSPLFAFRTVFSLLLGAFLFDERLSMFQVFLVAIIFIAGLFVSVDEHLHIKSFFKKSIALAFGAIICSATLGATVKYAMQLDGYWEVTLWGSILSVILSLVTLPLFLRDIRKIPLRNYRGVFASVVVAIVGTLAINKAFAENISITSAIFAVPTAMIFAFLFSLFAPTLLEKHTMNVYAIRFIAAAVMILAALRLTA